MDKYSVLAAIKDLTLNGIPKTDASQGSIKTIITIVITTAGAISLLFVVIGGLRYILSQGDPQGVSKAKQTIIYAVLGLVIAISAQAIVSLVILRAGK
jgi:hypothetical protein